MSDSEIERLEFLGDYIFNSVVAAHLFEIFPNDNEGELSTKTSKLICRNNLNNLGKKINILEYCQYVNKEDGFKDLEGNLLESIIGAIYLERGYNRTKKVILKLLYKHQDINQIINNSKNYKTILIDYFQKHNIKFTYNGESLSNNKYKCIVQFGDNKAIEIISTDKKSAQEELSLKIIKKLKISY